MAIESPTMTEPAVGGGEAPKASRAQFVAVRLDDAEILEMLRERSLVAARGTAGFGQGDAVSLQINIPLRSLTRGDRDDLTLSRSSQPVSPDNQAIDEDGPDGASTIGDAELDAVERRIDARIAQAHAGMDRILRELGIPAAAPSATATDAPSADIAGDIDWLLERIGAGIAERSKAMD